MGVESMCNHECRSFYSSNVLCTNEVATHEQHSLVNFVCNERQLFLGPVMSIASTVQEQNDLRRFTEVESYA